MKKWYVNRKYRSRRSVLLRYRERVRKGSVLTSLNIFFCRRNLIHETTCVKVGCKVVLPPQIWPSCLSFENRGCVWMCLSLWMVQICWMSKVYVRSQCNYRIKRKFNACLHLQMDWIPAAWPLAQDPFTVNFVQYFFKHIFHGGLCEVIPYYSHHTLKNSSSVHI